MHILFVTEVADMIRKPMACRSFLTDMNEKTIRSCDYGNNVTTFVTFGYLWYSFCSKILVSKIIWKCLIFGLTSMSCQNEGDPRSWGFLRYWNLKWLMQMGRPLQVSMLKGLHTTQKGQGEARLNNTIANMFRLLTWKQHRINPRLDKRVMPQIEFWVWEDLRQTIQWPAMLGHGLFLRYMFKWGAPDRPHVLNQVKNIWFKIFEIDR